LRTEQLPGDKAARIRELLLEQPHVAMAGDGVNDAEALSSASLGVSLGSPARTRRGRSPMSC